MIPGQAVVNQEFQIEIEHSLDPPYSFLEKRIVSLPIDIFISSDFDMKNLVWLKEMYDWFQKNPEFYFQTKSYVFSGQVDFALNVLKNMLTLHFVISGLLFHITV